LRLRLGVAGCFAFLLLVLFDYFRAPDASTAAAVLEDELPEAELVAMEGEDGPWIQQLPEELRDALADAQASRLPAVAEQWVHTEEC
jgi:hypothetical protein